MIDRKFMPFKKQISESLLPKRIFLIESGNKEDLFIKSLFRIQQTLFENIFLGKQKSLDSV